MLAARPPVRPGALEAAPMPLPAGSPLRHNSMRREARSTSSGGVRRSPTIDRPQKALSATVSYADLPVIDARHTISKPGATHSVAASTAPRRSPGASQVSELEGDLTLDPRLDRTATGQGRWPRSSGVLHGVSQKTELARGRRTTAAPPCWWRPPSCPPPSHPALRAGPEHGGRYGGVVDAGVRGSAR